MNECLIHFYKFIPIIKKKIFFNASKIIFINLLLVYFTISTLAQEINFEDFSSKYSVNLSELNMGEELTFGQVAKNEGLKSIDILESKVMLIEGIKYLDVLVDVDAGDFLYLGTDISCNESNTNCIPFTLKAAYTNRGTNDPSQATLMQVTSNFATAQFPILARQNTPPGPPPTPDYEGYDPTLFNETAYLYIYGSLNVGDVNAGDYSGEITITVTYD
jgi:hypothetical protein